MKSITIVAILITFWSRSFSQEPKGTLYLYFNHFSDNEKLGLNDPKAIYHNANGDDYKVAVFKYYISNIKLLRKNGRPEILPSTYFLVDVSDTLTLARKITDIPVGEYSGISFIIGVDSARNFAGAQADDLDPSRGMFWTWNNGYIFLKFEGESIKSTARQHRLTFHIGGVENPNTIKIFKTELDQPLVVTKEKPAKLEFKANVMNLFRGKTVIDFSKLNTVMGGANANIIAENYAGNLFELIVRP